MHIAIDDTYSSNIEYQSEYTTDQRRTHIAIGIPDAEVDEVRSEIKSCLNWVNENLNIAVSEFHFVDIYNRNPPWDKLTKGENLRVFEAFFHIYKHYSWKIFLQTLDNYSYADHDLTKFNMKFENLDLKKREHLCLFFVLLKVKKHYQKQGEKLVMYIDEGIGKPGQAFGNDIFSNYPYDFRGEFRSSSKEPLLQLADFIAFTINRNTHLQGKMKRTEVDNWFLEKFCNARFNCDDLTHAEFNQGYSKITVDNFDSVINEDRITKGLTS